MRTLLQTSRGQLWLACTVLFALSLLARLGMANRFSPFVDYRDEPFYIALAQQERGIQDAGAIIDLYGEFPPLYITFSQLVQEAYDVFKPYSWNLPADYYVPMRLLSALFGALTALAIGWIGWHIGGLAGGVLGASVWGIAPVLVEHSTLAIPDPLLYLFVAVATATALQAWRDESPRWLTVSLLAGIGAMYTKGWVLTAVFPFVAVAGWLILRQPRRMLGWGIGWGVLALASAANLLGGQMSTEAWRAPALDRLTNPSFFWQHLQAMASPMGWLFWLGLGVGALGVLRLPVRARWMAGAVALVTAITIELSVLVDVVPIEDNYGAIRHILPATVTAVGFWGGVCAAGLQALAGALRVPLARAQVALVAGALVFVAGVYLPPLLERVQYFSKTHVLERVWTWSDVALPNDMGRITMPLSGHYASLYDRLWGAYRGDNPLPTWGLNINATEDAFFMSATPQDYVERGIPLMGIEDKDIARYRAQGVTFFDYITPIKRFVVDEAREVGFDGGFYLIRPPDVLVNVPFGGEIVLYGYDISATSLKGGETLVLRPYWQRPSAPTSNYNLFIHLYAEDGQTILAQSDGALAGTRRLTLQWDDPDELYIGRTFLLVLPEDLPSGAYRLALGVYDPLTGQRLPTPDGDFYEIAVRVE